ncbi:MAG: tyrosine-type recombinase/integrase [Planctomycetaceae bacterium]
MAKHELTTTNRPLSLTAAVPVPALIESAGRKTKKRFVEFFAAEIRNRNTRESYMRNVDRFLAWCDLNGIQSFEQIEPVVIAGYIEQKCPEVRSEKLAPIDGGRPATPFVSDSSAKQHLAAIRRMFDYLITGGLLEVNPAAAVRGPSVVIDKGKTPIMTPDELRMLLDSIDTTKIAGLRDRALIYLMFNTFGRVGAIITMQVEDVFKRGDRYRIRLQEKGGKYLENWLSHKASGYVTEYIAEAGLSKKRGTPLFRTLDRYRNLTNRALQRPEVLAMIKRRAKKVGINPETCSHSLRATGITEYMKNGGTLESAQRRAGHRSPRTTNIYNRAADDDDEDEFECEKVGI